MDYCKKCGNELRENVKHMEKIRNHHIWILGTLM